MERGRPREFARETALDKATETFWRQGYRATSTADLLAHMGIARQSFYNTFGGKRALFIEALGHYGANYLKPIRDQLGAPGPPLDNVRRTLRLWQDFNSEEPCFGCLMCNSLAEFGVGDSEVSGVLKDLLKQMEDAFCGALQRAQAAGQLAETTDVRALARTLTNTGQGIALMGKINVGREVIGDIVRTSERLLV